MSQIDFDAIETFLNKFGDGDVILSNKYFDRGIAIIYLSNPGKKNAFSGQMMAKFRHCIETLEKWKEGKAVLLCGLGGNFSSGGDLDVARATGTKEEANLLSTWMQDANKRLQKLPLLTVCLVQGPTLGGGAEVSLFCDFIIAADDVRYGFVHGKMGIITAWGGATRLVQKIGERKALDVFLRAQVMSAEECLKVGIVDCIVRSEVAFEKALEWIENRIQLHSSVVHSFKKVVSHAAINSYEDSLNFEREAFSLTWGAKPNREALAQNIKHLSNKNAKM